MIIVLMIVRLVVPVVSTTRWVNAFIILLYAAVGVVVYFAYAIFSNLTKNIFGNQVTEYVIGNYVI